MKTASSSSSFSTLSHGPQQLVDALAFLVVHQRLQRVLCNLISFIGVISECFGPLEQLSSLFGPEPTLRACAERMASNSKKKPPTSS